MRTVERARSARPRSLVSSLAPRRALGPLVAALVGASIGCVGDYPRLLLKAIETTVEAGEQSYVVKTRFEYADAPPFSARELAKLTTEIEGERVARTRFTYADGRLTGQETAHAVPDALAPEVKAFFGIGWSARTDTWAYAYNDDGQLAKIDASHVLELASGDRDASQDPTLERDYDDQGRLAMVVEKGRDRDRFSMYHYDEQGRLQDVETDAGEEVFNWNDTRLASYQSTTGTRHALYALTYSGSELSEMTTGGLTFELEYDDQGRLSARRRVEGERKTRTTLEYEDGSLQGAVMLLPVPCSLFGMDGVAQHRPSTLPGVNLPWLD